MSETYGFVTNEELIEFAVDSIDSSCHEYCTGNCNCDTYADLLKERFLHV